MLLTPTTLAVAAVAPVRSVELRQPPMVALVALVLLMHLPAHQLLMLVAVVAAPMQEPLALALVAAAKVKMRRRRWQEQPTLVAGAVGLEQLARQVRPAAAVSLWCALRVLTLPLMVQQQSAAQQPELTQVAALITPTTHSTRLAR